MAETRRLHDITGRLGMPGAVVACTLACSAMAITYVGLYAYLRATDPAMGQAMLRLFGLTIATGRETALFDAQRNGMPLGLSIGLSVIDDLMTLLFNVVVVWLLVSGLGRVSWTRRLLARIETQALRHRRWVQRWGLAGLAVFYMLPGFGSGPAVAAGIGVLARIPVGRLALTLGAGVSAVDVLWAVGVYYPANAFPDIAWLDWVPLIVLSLLVAVTAFGLWKDRHNRGVALLDWDPRPSPQHEAAIAQWGLRRIDGLVEARLPQVAAATGLPRSLALFAAELLLLEGMRPEVAARLVRLKVRGIPDLVRTPAGELAADLSDVDEARLQAWQDQGDAMLDRVGAVWEVA